VWIATAELADAYEALKPCPLPLLEQHLRHSVIRNGYVEDSMGEQPRGSFSRKGRVLRRRGPAVAGTGRRRWHPLIGALVATTSLIVTPAGAGASPAWKLVHSPNYTGTYSNSLLEGVSCASAKSCEAVGYHFTGRNAQRTLAESWNGSAWSLVASPNIGSNTTLDTNVLWGVSCPGVNSCEAVGSYFNDISGYERTLVEYWNGSVWSLVSSVNDGWNDNSFGSVSCLSPDWCKAVGYFLNAKRIQRTLVESWNGRVWSLESSPNSGMHSNDLEGVSCSSVSSCKAVGGYLDSHGVIRTLAESWNGHVWSLAPSPNNGTRHNELGHGGVSCVSARSCKAVGFYLNSKNRQQTLVESWNGHVWSLDPSPNHGTYANALQGVACVSSSSCQAVGNYRAGTGAQWTLVETWNGKVWSLASGPNVNNGTLSFNVLASVSCVSAGSCRAAGSYHLNTNIRSTLAGTYG